MRAQREKVQLLQKGGADPQEVMLQKAQYQGQLNEYAVFSRKMGLKEERERIYIDGRGRVAPSKDTLRTAQKIMNTDSNYNVAQGFRRKWDSSRNVREFIWI